MRVAIIVLVFLVATVFGFINYLNTANELNQIQNSVVETATGASTVSVQQAATRPAIEPQVVTIEKHPMGSDDPSLTLAEQLERQPDWLRSVADEDLVTEADANPNGLPYPSLRRASVDERGELLVKRYEENARVVRRWNPFTGDTKAVLMLEGFDIVQGLVGETGLFFLVREISSAYVNVDILVYIDESGIATMAPLWSVRDGPHLVLLPDESLMIVGGRDTVTKRQLNTVEMATVSQGRLEVEAMHDFPGPPRRDYSVVALADNRLMVLGGSTSTHTRCDRDECTNRTFVLNPKSRLWDTGPIMLHARAAATASLLADGSILVTGGWEADRTGNSSPSYTSERGTLGKYRFERAAQLPVAMTDHRAMRLTRDSSSPLLLLDTRSSSVLTYDPVRDEFRAVGGYSSLMSFELGPFSDGQEHFFWVSGDNRRAWSRQDIRVGDHVAARGVPSSRTVHLFRSASSFLPAENGHSALVIGGNDRDSDESIAAVDSYSIQTGLQALVPMPIARYGARTLRLRNGVVVVAGGTSDHPEYDSWNEDASPLPLQILSEESGNRKWHSVAVNHPPDTQYAKWMLGGLIAIVDGKAVEHLSFNLREPHSPEVKKTPLPDLPAFRDSRSPPESKVVAKGLNDGRLIVAGGIVHEKRIAVMQASPDEPQRFIGRGDLVMADTYEIYDPVQRRWTTSEPSAKRGGQVQIMDNGRVVKLHLEIVPNGPEHDGSLSIEISQTDGRGWTTLDAKWPSRIEATSARLITLDNELFLSGPSIDAGDASDKRILQWFNAVEKEWNTVWTEGNTEADSVYQDVLAIVDIADRQHLLVPVGGQ